MSTDLTLYSDYRAIPDAFMNTGSSPDAWVNELEAIDCSLVVAGGQKRSICCGIVAKSTNDSSGLAEIKVMGRGGNAIVSLWLAVGIIHPMNIKYLFPSDANGVVLCY